jgi:hypothetical protein
MPITQQRLTTIVESGLYYMDIIQRLRNLAPHLANVAREEYDKLGEQSDKLYECFISLAETVMELSPKDYTAYHALLHEAEHLKRVAKGNDYRRRKMASLRARRKEEKIEAGEPDMGMELFDPRLKAIHARLWAIEEKESWNARELADIIKSEVADMPTHEAIRDLVRTNRILHNQATDRYMIMNPEHMAGGDQSEEATTDESLPL